MKPIASFFLAAAVAAVTLVPASAQRTAASTDAGDFTEGNLKFHRVGTGFFQVVDTTKNQSAGTVILPPNAAPVYAPMPGYDLKTAYEKHMNGSSSAAPAADKTETPSAVATEKSQDPPPATGFDPATKTVGLSDGRSVTFVDDENLRVQMPGPAGAKTYDLHFHRASAGGVMKGWAGREQGRTGGSLGGGGVTFSLKSQGGMPGGEVYDTAKGTTYGSSGFQQAKAVTAAVREAVDIVKSKGQSDLAKQNVVKSLLSNNLGI